VAHADRQLLDHRLQAFIDQGPLAVYVYRPEGPGPNAYMSRQLEAILGYSAEEWTADPDLFSKVLHPEDRDWVLAEQRRTQEAGEPFRAEYRMMTRDGRVLWFLDEAHEVAGREGEPAYHYGYLLEITERKELEAELARQKAYYQELHRLSPVAIVTLDRDNRVLSWNPAAERLFGYTQGEAIDRPLRDLLVPTEDLREESRAVQRQAEDHGLAHVIARRARKDGVLVDVEILTVPLVVDGERTGFLVLYHDITELLRAREDAEAATQAKSAFLATMSHEIRTPMNAVIGMGGLLLDTELTDEQREFAEVIRTSGEALMRIIDDILDFSKIEAGKLELEYEPLDVRDCAESALDLVAVRASEKELEIGCLIDEDVPIAILGDPTRLRQALGNLLANAVKFTEAGEVVLTVVTETGGDVPRRLRFSVRDTGIGIPAERMPDLFESFSQMDVSTTRRYGGTGLGLAISKRLAELMGGTLWVDSEEGKGSVFHFEIPAREVAPPARYDRGEAEPRIAGKRLLVVDDSATNREILIRQAESWGMLVEAVGRPADALDRVRRGDRFDAAVLDMRMPEMDGLALAREIRRYRGERDLPLVLLTSIGRLAVGGGPPELSAQLTKPVKASQLYEALVRVLAAEAAPASTPGGEGYDSRPAVMALRLLVAEDNAVNRQLALALLAKLGYQADVVENGREALDAVEREAYDVVLMDVQMPELDGLEVTRRIRDRFGSRGGPMIIATTANAMEGDREECLEAGMDDYLSKPIRLDDLARALARCRPLARTGAQRTVPGGSGTGSRETLDHAALESLVSSFGGGDEGWGTVRELLDTFLEDAAAQIATLRDAIERGDAEEAQRTAHTLKSSSATFGANSFAELCRELETLGRREEFDAAPELLERAENEWERLEKALAAARQSSSTAR
jgi:PAS domain S-box-containing protein